LQTREAKDNANASRAPTTIALKINSTLWRDDVFFEVRKEAFLKVTHH
jgi:hypothetical protein